MKNTKKKQLFIILLISIALFACNIPIFNTPNIDTGALFTEAASTLQAMTEIASHITPSPTPTNNGLTQTPIVTVEITPNPSEPAGVCNKASFHSDVNIPDGTVFPPNTNFTKIWKIKNEGTCTWTTDYAIVFADGYGMGANAAIPFASEVAPGEFVEIEIDLEAPMASGVYRGDWKLRASNGVVFGLGDSGDKSFWVEIEVVAKTTNYVYDFAYHICSAEWSASSGSNVICPNGAEGNEGYIKYLTEPNLEGTVDDELGILVNPGEGVGSWVEGVFPVRTIYEGDYFTSKVACEGGAENCSLKFMVSYYLGDTKAEYSEWIETYEGQFTSINIDLSFLAGKNIRLVLRVENRISSSTDAKGIWFVPIIDN